MIRSSLAVSRRLLLRLALLIAFAMPALAPVSAWAQGEVKEPTEEELAAARALFKDAMDREAANDWEQALEILEKVAQVKMTPQVRYHIALCKENLGSLVEAINGFELAEQEARAQGEAGRSVADNAPKHAAKLRARVAQLRIRVTGRISVSKIFIDGRDVSLALLDTDIPVDPGKHRVQVKRDGEVVDDRDIVLGEAQSKTIELTIDDPEPLKDPEPNPYQPDPQPDKPEPVPVKDVDPFDPAYKLPAYAVAAAGGAMLIASGALWGLRGATIKNVRCDDPDAYTGCNPDDSATAELGQRYDIASKVMLGVGLAAVAAGVTLWFLLPTDDGSAPAAFGIEPVGAGGRLHVRF
jgi:tetratricopeptide (TPR) repeat protein